jgi:hypothetical protein
LKVPAKAHGGGPKRDSSGSGANSPSGGSPNGSARSPAVRTASSGRAVSSSSQPLRGNKDKDSGRHGAAAAASTDVISSSDAATAAALGIEINSDGLVATSMTPINNGGAHLLASGGGGRGGEVSELTSERIANADSLLSQSVDNHADAPINV